MRHSRPGSRGHPGDHKPAVCGCGRETPRPPEYGSDPRHGYRDQEAVPQDRRRDARALPALLGRGVQAEVRPRLRDDGRAGPRRAAAVRRRHAGKPAPAERPLGRELPRRAVLVRDLPARGGPDALRVDPARRGVRDGGVADRGRAWRRHRGADGGRRQRRGSRSGFRTPSASARSTTSAAPGPAARSLPAVRGGAPARGVRLCRTPVRGAARRADRRGDGVVPQGRRAHGPGLGGAGGGSRAGPHRGRPAGARAQHLHEGWRLVLLRDPRLDADGGALDGVPARDPEPAGAPRGASRATW